MPIHLMRTCPPEFADQVLFKRKPAKAGWTTVHGWLSCHQLKLVASMPEQIRSLIVVALCRSHSAHERTNNSPMFIDSQLQL